VKVKICGVTRAEDARSAAVLGADYVGAVLSPGFGRSVTPEQAATYRSGDGPTLVAVLVDPAVEDAVRWARRAGAGVLQLHGEEPPALLGSLRDAAEWSLWKAVRVAEAEDVRRAVEAYAPVADGLLLDGRAHGGRGGGHGVRFPWAAAEEARDALEGLLFVAAGGLTPENVGEVVRRLEPDVVDVSSGVEAGDGSKDPELVSAFIRNARAARGS
jgi:phosphoribosylanthranilate isomerase